MMNFIDSADCRTPGGRFISAGGMVACAILLAGGLGHRWVERVLAASDAAPVALNHPLAELPLEIGPWRGTEIPLDKRLLDFAGCDDSVYRHYVAGGSGDSLDLYVAYAARPAKMLGHRPQQCYPAHGWMHQETRKSRIDLPEQPGFDCLIHLFRRPPPGHGTVMVLNYYVLRGRHVTEWTEFWGPSWRRPNLSRDPSFYVVQVQVSAAFEDGSRHQNVERVLKGFTALVAPAIHALLPASEPQP